MYYSKKLTRKVGNRAAETKGSSQIGEYFEYDAHHDQYVASFVRLYEYSFAINHMWTAEIMHSSNGQRFTRNHQQLKWWSAASSKMGQNQSLLSTLIAERLEHLMRSLKVSSCAPLFQAAKENRKFNCVNAREQTIRRIRRVRCTEIKQSTS